MRIYLDFNASTPIAPEVGAVMRPYLDQHFGNPSSGHWAGQPARDAVETARGEVASLLGCAAEEVVLTSGGSEANNHVIKGTVFDAASPTPHIITTSVEHPAVVEPCRFVERFGARVTTVPVDRHGLVDPDDIRRAMTPETVLISVMHANNEVGTIQPIAAIARIAREHGVLCHTDAAQSVAKIATRVDDLGVDLLSLAGHKLYAPKGIGALYVRRGVTLTPLIHGGGHERGQRAGTETALLAAGLGTACRLAESDPCGDQVLKLREQFWKALRDTFGDRVVLNGHPTKRLPNTLSVAFPGRFGDEILARLDGVAASTGSACHTGDRTMSPVLAAMGIVTNIGFGTIRFSLGRTTTEAEIDQVVGQLEACV
ncbi:MAG: cysteine desulfurase family protein [Vicinamibacterales bacterium]|nr:cysteine desulfurase family protein [Vicinamibacterales bacterium]MDP7690308.1 cysteine desulfurase family protein [Vicinamibacterales bacterium]HJN44136.1 cysteine desulfurase family protein [Vicinamibacterales bacterium]